MTLALADPSVAVKNSAAWALAKVVDQFPDIATNEDVLPDYLQVMSAGLESVPRVASNCCVVCAVGGSRDKEGPEATKRKGGSRRFPPTGSFLALISFRPLRD